MFPGLVNNPSLILLLDQLSMLGTVPGNSGPLDHRLGYACYYLSLLLDSPPFKHINVNHWHSCLLALRVTCVFRETSNHDTFPWLKKRWLPRQDVSVKRSKAVEHRGFQPRPSDRVLSFTFNCFITDKILTIIGKIQKEIQNLCFRTNHFFVE